MGTREESAFVDFVGLLESLPALTAQEVRILQSQAMAYVWGWQDAGGAERDSDVAWKFGLAYGIYAGEYAAGKRHSRTNIQDAFRSWRDGLPIGERRTVSLSKP